MKSFVLVLACTGLIFIATGCVVTSNTNKAASNSNSNSSGDSKTAAVKENSITVTTEGTKYLDGATLPTTTVRCRSLHMTRANDSGWC